MCIAPGIDLDIMLHTRHILHPSEIDLGLCLVVLQAQKGNTYFTELAERVEYGNYVMCNNYFFHPALQNST